MSDYRHPPIPNLPAGNPWDRQPEESHSAYAAFRCYLKLDGARTLRRAMYAYRALQKAQGRSGTRGPEAQETPGKETAPTSGWITSIASRWSWLARAMAWDEHRMAVMQEREEKLARAEAAKLVERKRKSKQRHWEAATKLHHKLQALLDRPGVPDPKDLKEMALALTKIGEAEARAVGEMANLTMKATVPPEWGQALQEFLAQKAAEQEPGPETGLPPELEPDA